MIFRFNGANGPDGTWTSTKNPPLTVVTTNCMLIGGTFEAELETAEYTVTQDGDSPRIKNWFISMGFEGTEYVWTSEGELPLSIRVENITAILPEVGPDANFTVYALPRDPSPNLARDEELQAVVVMRMYDYKQLDVNRDFQQCHVG